MYIARLMLEYERRKSAAREDCGVHTGYTQRRKKANTRDVGCRYCACARWKLERLWAGAGHTSVVPTFRALDSETYYSVG
jgi:hypothetical protein